jgi:hypothetical protein
VGLEAFWYEAMFLFLFAFVMIGLAVRKFRKRVA